MSFEERVRDAFFRAFRGVRGRDSHNERAIRKSEKERQNVFFCLTVAAFVHIFKHREQAIPFMGQRGEDAVNRERS